MDTKEAILSRIIPGIAQKLGVDEKEITPETRFADDLGVDSLDSVELLMDAEKEFNIEISDDAIDETVTVEDAVTLIQNCQVEAEEKARKKQEELDRKLKELGPARLAWEALEEKQSKEYIERTGKPYFIYDGTPSKCEEQFTAFVNEKGEAEKAGKYSEWLLEKVSQFMGKTISELNIETVSDVVAFSQSISYERVNHSFGSSFSRFGCGCHLVVLPNGEKREISEMELLATPVKAEVLSSCLLPLCPQTLKLKRLDKKGNCVLFEGRIESFFHSEGWEFEWESRKNGTGKASFSSLNIDPVTGEWTSLNGRYVFEPIGSASQTAYGKINTFIRKVQSEVERKLLLERASFKFGLQAKSITPSLVKKVNKVNRECAQLCHEGGDYVTKDGRHYHAYDILNPSTCLFRDMITYLIARKDFVFSLIVDGERCSFIPYKYIAFVASKNRVILEGILFGESGRKTEIFDLSLNGGKCRRAREGVWSISYIKGDVKLVDSERNIEAINRLSFLLNSVLYKENIK